MNRNLSVSINIHQTPETFRKLKLSTQLHYRLFKSHESETEIVLSRSNFLVLLFSHTDLEYGSLFSPPEKLPATLHSIYPENLKGFFKRHFVRGSVSSLTSYWLVFKSVF